MLIWYLSSNVWLYFIKRVHVCVVWWIFAYIPVLPFDCNLNSNCIQTPPRHDDVIKWKNFPRYWPFVRGIHRSPSQITILTIVCATKYSGADQRKHQSSVSLTFVQGIHRWQVNSPHKGPVTRKMFPFVDVIMASTDKPVLSDNFFCYILFISDRHIHIYICIYMIWFFPTAKD